MFLPDQVGVGVKDGATAVAHAVRVLVEEHGGDESRALLKVD
jgi:hypothetical protein